MDGIGNPIRFFYPGLWLCVCVLSTRFVGRSENHSTRFLNWSCLLLTPLSGMSLVEVMCAWCCGRTLLCFALVYGDPCRVCLCFFMSSVQDPRSCVIVCCMSSIRNPRLCVCVRL